MPVTNITKPQQRALAGVYHRPVDHHDGQTFLEFRRSIGRGSFDCIMVQWCGMWLGIEIDGHTHS